MKNILIQLLPDWFVSRIVMHGLRNQTLKTIAPVTMLKMCEYGLNTPDADCSQMHANMDVLDKRYKVILKCTWEEIEKP